jgi:hypothetical protein
VSLARRAACVVPADPPDAELTAKDCFFPKTDRAPGQPCVAAFKRISRVRQAEWRERNGLPIGSHSGRDGDVPNGSRIAPSGPLLEDLRNFISDRIDAAVADRSSYREPYEQLSQPRLRWDLLSSMPMCFNLFGELHDDERRLTRAGQTLFGATGSGLRVRFEHSPGRQKAEFTNDGTAFDVALFFDDPAGSEMVVGVETKYHEHALKERAPAPLKMERYRHIAGRAQEEGVFKPGWEKVLGTDLQQVWRDHLLLLSMLQHPRRPWTSGRYVLVHPRCNPAFGDAGRRYSDLLDDDATFMTATIEQLLAPGVLHPAATGVAFRERYLW